eukprot:scaffold28733_cov79-Isochrysis_galbana.AAC.1
MSAFEACAAERVSISMPSTCCTLRTLRWVSGFRPSAVTAPCTSAAPASRSPCRPASARNRSASAAAASPADPGSVKSATPDPVPMASTLRAAASADRMAARRSMASTATRSSAAPGNGAGGAGTAGAATGGGGTCGGATVPPLSVASAPRPWLRRRPVACGSCFSASHSTDEAHGPATCCPPARASSTARTALLSDPHTVGTWPRTSAACALASAGTEPRDSSTASTRGTTDAGLKLGRAAASSAEICKGGGRSKAGGGQAERATRCIFARALPSRIAHKPTAPRSHTRPPPPPTPKASRTCTPSSPPPPADRSVCSQSAMYSAATRSVAPPSHARVAAPTCARPRGCLAFGPVGLLSRAVLVPRRATPSGPPPPSAAGTAPAAPSTAEPAPAARSAVVFLPPSAEATRA